MDTPIGIRLNRPGVDGSPLRFRQGVESREEIHVFDQGVVIKPSPATALLTSRTDESIFSGSVVITTVHLLEDIRQSVEIWPV